MATVVPCVTDVAGSRWRPSCQPSPYRSMETVDFMSEVRPRLRLFNDISHYEGIPERLLSARLPRWWGHS